MTPAISVEGVTVRYGDVEALHLASVSIAPGRACGLVGMNGSGKSTLFKAIMGLVKPDTGTPPWPPAARWWACTAATTWTPLPGR